MIDKERELNFILYKYGIPFGEVKFTSEGVFERKKILKQVNGQSI